MPETAKPTYEKRSRMLDQIKRSRLGGIDRIVLDQMNDEPLLRYAHICKGSASTTAHTNDDPQQPDPGYVRLIASDAGWSYVGCIDLDTGDLVEDSAGPLLDSPNTEETR